MRPWLALSAVLAPASALAATLSVGSAPGAYGTIEAAAAAARPGDTVVVQPGSYAGGFTTGASGVTYTCATLGTCRIVGAGRASAVNAAAWENRGNDVTIEGFAIDGAGAQAASWAFGLYNAGTRVTVLGNMVENIMTDPAAYARLTAGNNGGAGIMMDSYYGGSAGTVSGNRVLNIGPAGIKSGLVHGIYQTETGTVSGNTISNVAGDGVSTWHDAHDIAVTQNVISGARGSCVLLAGGGSGAGPLAGQGLSQSGNICGGGTSAVMAPPPSPPSAVSGRPDAGSTPATVAPQPTPIVAPQAAPQMALPTPGAVCASLSATQSLLPCGPLHTEGASIVGQDGRAVRLVCAAWWGDLPDWDRQMLTIVRSTFNCLRISFVNSSLDDDLALIDRTVASAAKVRLRVVIDNHLNERGSGGGAQQPNGLWYDKGGASDNTDGGKPAIRGTVDDARWIADWVRVAQHYAGNDTVIGYDLKNEPTGYGKGSTWGDGNIARDIRLAYQRAGKAIQAVDDTKLIIAEGVQDYGNGAPMGDLRPVRYAPVVLPVANKLVYSVHEYPPAVAGNKPSAGAAYVANMEAVWGWLVRGNIAPVWIGEMGASMNSASDKAWADTIVAYINGLPHQVGIDWWMWSNCPNCQPNGALMPDRVRVRDEQAAVFTQFRQVAGDGVAGSPAVSSLAIGQQLSAVSSGVWPATPDAPAPVVLPAAPAPTGAVNADAILAAGADAIANGRQALP